MWFSSHTALPECKMSSLAGKAALWLLPNSIYKLAELNWMRTEQGRGSCDTNSVLPFERHQLCDSCVELALQKRRILKKQEGKHLSISKAGTGHCKSFFRLPQPQKCCICVGFFFPLLPSSSLISPSQTQPLFLGQQKDKLLPLLNLGHSQLAPRLLAEGSWPCPHGDCTFHSRATCAAVLQGARLKRCSQLSAPETLSSVPSDEIKYSWESKHQAVLSLQVFPSSQMISSSWGVL